MENEKIMSKIKTEIEILEPSPEEKIALPEEVWYAKCPVCRKSRLDEEIKNFLGFFKVSSFSCRECSSRLQKKGHLLELIDIGTDPYSVGTRFQKGAKLSDKEWHRIAYGGLSDAELNKKVIERQARQKELILKAFTCLLQ